MDPQFRDEVFVVTFALENAAVSRSLVPSSGIASSVMAVEISSAGDLFAQG
ncbi:hypothetical protein OAF37_03245 [Rubripirellula sp.]|mgnify:CR=1 FL=1|nr:hypothetical protein [Rubripirellula sp.]MDA7874691.1 hypothetical protein [Rhodopirellula sp.]MDB4770939.1 hypothetical protein [bacterium]MDB4394130.1 hypothetical protein [Rhodopirellula sp.]MDB4621754.1 hypothetical protein [Rubripirellula sp.]MDB4645052.1 hypothetical protein [Rubripirellula sp.]